MCGLTCGAGATRIPDFRSIVTMDGRLLGRMWARPFPERPGVAGLAVRRIERCGEAWYPALPATRRGEVAA
jgi:hypothetical protein